MFTIFMFLSCTTQIPANGDGEYNWGGFVYSDIPSDVAEGLTTGDIEVRNSDNETMTFGLQADPQNPGNWQLPIERSEAVSIRISGPEQLTTVWRANTPPANAFWFSGTFFAVKAETIVPLWDSLSGLIDTTGIETDRVHLYGESLSLNEADLAAWTKADITIYDGDGAMHNAVTLSTTDDGFMQPSGDGTGPITAFTAINLAPGEIRLVIDASDGRTMVMDYFAEPGDLLSAFAFTLPEQ